MSARPASSRAALAVACLALAGLSAVACGREAGAPEPSMRAADSAPQFTADTQMIVDSLGNELMIVSKRTAHLLPREVRPRAGAGDPAAPDAWRVVDARSARSLMRAATPPWYVIDVRDSRSFATRGHLRGAALVPLEVLEANVADLHVRTDQIVLLYADNEARATDAARILAGYGFPNLRVLGGGMAAWERESLPVEGR
jgi:rhodanese-related sulfurtransferase